MTRLVDLADLIWDRHRWVIGVLGVGALLGSRWTSGLSWLLISAAGAVAVIRGYAMVKAWGTEEYAGDDADGGMLAWRGLIILGVGAGFVIFGLVAAF
jgi:hypothetical protein